MSLKQESRQTSAAEPTRARPCVWGLRAPDLHDAFWRSQGIQCLRRGVRTELQAGADLYLLIEPDQLVLFDLPAFADDLAWRNAALTRLRVQLAGEIAYGEHVELDDNGRVLRIARRYRPRRHAAYRAVLTRSRRFARTWMAAERRHEGWRDMHRQAGWSNTEGRRCSGECFIAGDAEDEARLIDRLVERWPAPNNALGGIEEVRPGVWSLPNQPLKSELVSIGPAWLGRADPASMGPCVVGPAWVADTESHGNGNGNGNGSIGVAAATLRDIALIEPPEKPTGLSYERSRLLRLPHAVPKRIFDVLASAVALVLLMPIFLVIAVCILVDDGRPIFFGHVRQTLGGRRFKCLKFRTMGRDADKVKDRLRQGNLCDGPQFYMPNDPRVTRVGRYLRCYHIDELPQLWNVLVGEMSLVGPRPSPDRENRICPSWREMRLSVRPGITGLWQLNRTREPGTDFQEWIRWDLEYVEQATLWLDLKIMVATAREILGRGKSNAD